AQAAVAASRTITSHVPLPQRGEEREGLRQLDHDVLGVGRPGTQPLVPGAYVLQLRAHDVERVPAIDEAADRDVAHGEMLAADVLAALQPAVEPAEQAAGILGALLDRRHVALLGWRT